MPTYHKNEDGFITTYITGPTHNYLSLSFSEEEEIEIEVIPQPHTKEDQKKVIDENELRIAVLSGIDKANLEFNRNFKVSLIKYVSDDCPKYEIYESLAFNIIKTLILEPEKFKQL